jgi:ferrous iron transport protein B
MVDSGWAFLRRAGTLILAAMILVWALLYFPRVDPSGTPYDARIAALKEELVRIKERAATQEGEAKEKGEKDAEKLEEQINVVQAEWQGQSLLGRMGHQLEPVVKPLGWDWRIGMAALASFPAREVVVGTLGTIYSQGKVDTDEIREADRPGETRLAKALQDAEWDGQPGQKVFTVPVALSLMVFFALCCQCVSTLAVIRRETNGWRWPAFTFTYMTVLAYIGALVVYQISARIL